MKLLTRLLFGVCYILPTWAAAQWQVVESGSSGAVKTVVGAGTSADTVNTPADRTTMTQATVAAAQQSDTSSSVPEPVSSTIYQLDLQPGTLQENIERINKLQGNPWDIKWLAKNDYIVTGYPQVSGEDFYSAIGNLLQYYPLRAIFYKQNHVVAIVPRNS